MVDNEEESDHLVPSFQSSYGHNPFNYSGGGGLIHHVGLES